MQASVAHMPAMNETLRITPETKEFARDLLKAAAIAATGEAARAAIVALLAA